LKRFVFLLAVLLARPARGEGSVKIGLCSSSPTEWASAKRLGFDYVEVGVRNVAAMDDAAYERAKATARELAIPMPVANLFLPSELKVTGPDVDLSKVMMYAKTALARVAGLGVKTVVFGSGGARKVPDGFPRDRAWQQLVTFGKRVAPEAARVGITIAVEPLRREETNIVNSAGEGLRYVEDVAHPSFQLMVDLYHLATEHEDARVIIEAAPHIRHFHIANPNGRVYPMAADEYDYGPFFRALRRIGYAGGISVEGKTSKLDADGPRALTFLRAAAAGSAP
jgi:sugar phosphate isomerase/epimerase